MFRLFRYHQGNLSEIIEEELPFKVVHISEYLADLVDKKAIKFTKEIKKTVTYHDPCHLGRHARIFDAPRKVIESIPVLLSRRWKELERLPGVAGVDRGSEGIES